MKKILICLTIAWAIFFLNFYCAHKVEPELGYKIVQQDNTAGYYQLSSENLFLDDCLEDISNDDTDDSERKKPSSGTTSYINTSFFRQFFFDDTLKSILPSTFFFSSKASLLVFLCVFRI